MQHRGSTIEWQPAPLHLSLAPTGIHIWCGRCSAAPGSAESFTARLSGDEKERADRFVRASDRNRYIFAHAMLRSILGRYVGYRPRQLAFNNNAYGKPALSAPAGTGEIRFSMAHSGDIVLVAVNRSSEIGVDVELMRSMSDVHQVIKRCFSQEEQRHFDKLTKDQMQRTFFKYWTLKEAYLKGIGLGLSYPLEGVRMEREIGDLYTAIPMDRPRWHCLLISPCPGYVGALAAETIHTAPHYWEYDPAEGR